MKGNALNANVTTADTAIAMIIPVVLIVLSPCRQVLKFDYQSQGTASSGILPRLLAPHDMFLLTSFLVSGQPPAASVCCRQQQ